MLDNKVYWYYLEFRGSILGFNGAKMVLYVIYTQKMTKMAQNGVFMTS